MFFLELTQTSLCVYYYNRTGVYKPNGQAKYQLNTLDSEKLGVSAQNT